MQRMHLPRNLWRRCRSLPCPAKFIFAIAFSFLLFLTCLHSLPLPQSLHQQDYASLLLARDGSLLGAALAKDQQWRFAPVESLPEKYRQALLLFEDRNFYHHPGVDPLAIARAMKGNIRA